MRHLIVLIVAALSVACGEALRDQIREDTSVSDVGGCPGLEAEIEATAIREMDAEIDELIAGLEEGTTGTNKTTTLPAAAPAPTTSEDRQSASDYTTTNTQERGVDEPDFVKNDGSRIFVLNGRKLLALQAWPAESARIASSTELGPSDVTPAEMILHKDRLVVFSRSYGILPLAASTATSIAPSPGGSAQLVVGVYDVSGAVPRIVHEQRLDGSYVSARRTDNVVRFVSVAPRGGPQLVYWPERNVDFTKAGAVRAALEEARRENVRRIRAATLDDWLPRVFENGAPTRRECGSYLATNVSARGGFTTVSSLDLDTLATGRQTILNAADEVYASSDSLYLTARHTWMTQPSSDAQVRQNYTYIFKFDAAEGAQGVRYAASGGVAGQIVDPFALDEQDGYLRIATTRQTTIGWRAQDTTNNVFVLRAEGGRLKVVGELSGLARDESIYAARFEGARGFLVTYRQVDPLFTLDLADPRQPKVAGELKVPGFSTYLHPLDRDHILTIGRDIDAAGRWGGVQLQVFDVTSFANPAVMHRYTLGSSYSSSDAGWDHHAFTYFASRGLLAIPFSDWSAARASLFSSTLEVLRATVAGGIAPVGSIDHSDLLQGTQGRYKGWTPQVRRGVMMEDYVYSISYGGLKVHDVRDMRQPVATIVF